MMFMAGKEIYDLSLFEAVQLNSVLEDGKTFVDCIPKLSLPEIEDKYEQQKQQQRFDLKAFVDENFEMPPVFGEAYESNKQISVEENIRQLWNVLTREPNTEQSSLINLPFIYVVPGGRFREIYYWDSYFTMLGLQQHNRVDLIESMINNFAFLLRTYGHIPNGNRRYYLSRSQPPFFALMVTLLADIKKDEGVFIYYKKELELEYNFWQKGVENTHPGKGNDRVAKMPGGELLNRYYDNNPNPRQESYAEDVHVSKTSNQPKEIVFTNLRAGAESGWDFSSRWFADEQNINTIQTIDIIPVDLNCLLYTLETTITKANRLAGDTEVAKEFEIKSTQRMEAIQKYCWNTQLNFFCDYNLVKQQQQQNITAAGLFPLFVKMATNEQAEAVEQNTRKYLLKDGGLVTTNNHTGQQWDAPNGWAPLQWIAFVGLNNYGHHALAKEIAQRWLALNEKVFEATGKLMEKYNVEDLDKPAGGGEYPGQDGFGWTNGVYVALKNKLGATE
ncbi:MAG: trehalase [Ferruginibacter sp.]|nr:trehalase [Ferruginibacter sp.]